VTSLASGLDRPSVQKIAQLVRLGEIAKRLFRNIESPEGG